MILRPPRSTRTDTLFPYTTLFRSTYFIAMDYIDGPTLYRLTETMAGRDVRMEPAVAAWITARILDGRSEEHTSELQSLMRNSYAVFCLKKKKKKYLYQLTNMSTRYTL